MLHSEKRLNAGGSSPLSHSENASQELDVQRELTLAPKALPVQPEACTEELVDKFLDSLSPEELSFFSADQLGSPLHKTREPPYDSQPIEQLAWDLVLPASSLSTVDASQSTVGTSASGSNDPDLLAGSHSSATDPLHALRGKTFPAFSNTFQSIINDYLQDSIRWQQSKPKIFQGGITAPQEISRARVLSTQERAYL